MTKAADAFNAEQLKNKKLNIEHITELVRCWQAEHLDLTVDGMAGTKTIDSIERTIADQAGQGELTIAGGWLMGRGVKRVDAHSSWFGGFLARGKPMGIVAHFTDTAPGTALSMADRRARPFGQDPDDRSTSWHITIDADGSIVQMIPMNRVAWHAGSRTAQPVPGIGDANNNTTGIELVGFGKVFTPAQVASAARVWRAIVGHYGIPRQHAMITHQSIDPTRRDDPGPVWMGQHAAGVLHAAYA